MLLAKEGFGSGAGIWTDMNAIRPDERLDNTHSLYVDQWDWERVITRGERNTDFLMAVVTKIFRAMKMAEREISDKYSIVPVLPDSIISVSTKELERLYPKNTRKEREDLIAKDKGAVFLQGIGWDLEDGKPHDGRAPDYDDWNLNGDIFVWNPILQSSLELSSMGIRVDQESLIRQLEKRDALDRKGLKFHKALLNGKLPLSIGGGIGQSRFCMLLLQKAHIGEVQASEWPRRMVAELKKHGIELLSID
jgi:aspartate--ammonia ligase